MQLLYISIKPVWYALTVCRLLLYLIMSNFQTFSNPQGVTNLKEEKKKKMPDYTILTRFDPRLRAGIRLPLHRPWR